MKNRPEEIEKIMAWYMSGELYQEMCRTDFSKLVDYIIKLEQTLEQTNEIR